MICDNCWDPIREADGYNLMTLKMVLPKRSNGFRIFDVHGNAKMYEDTLLEVKLCDECAMKIIDLFRPQCERDQNINELKMEGDA